LSQKSPRCPYHDVVLAKSACTTTDCVCLLNATTTLSAATAVTENADHQSATSKQSDSLHWFQHSMAIF